MGRKQKYERRQLTSAALEIAAEAGARAVTVAAVAERVGAPTGSFYHRYPSREHLLGELWLELVEQFQAAFLADIDEAADADGAVRLVRRSCSWVREHTAESLVLLLHQRRDFVPNRWPEQLASRAAALDTAAHDALRGFARRIFGRAGNAELARVRFALVDVPLGAVRPYLESGKPLPASLEGLLETTVRAVLRDSQ